MLHFNNLDFYTIPALPMGWRAPCDLKVQLGMLAGRLYFEWDEYPHLAKFLGLSENDLATPNGEDRQLVEGLEADGVDSVDGLNKGDGANESHQSNTDTHTQPLTKLFVPSPLTFMQEWLAVRRHGQDVANTPMGFITQGKPLSGDHPFFRQDDETEERAALRGVTTAARMVAAKDKEEEMVYEGGIDIPMSDSDLSSEDEEGESDIVYHDDELYSDEDDDEEEGEDEEEYVQRGRRQVAERGRGRGPRGGRGR